MHKFKVGDRVMTTELFYIQTEGKAPERYGEHIITELKGTNTPWYVADRDEGFWERHLQYATKLDKVLR